MLQKAVVQFGCAIFLIYGMGFIFFPEQMIYMLTDSTPTTTSGLIDMRATYGGMSFGMGMTLLLAARNPQFHALGLQLLLLVLIFMATGHLYGILVDGAPNLMMYLYLLLEIFGSSICIYLLSERRELASNPEGVK